MAKRFRVTAVLAGIVLLAGCYHATIQTEPGAQPMSAPTHTIWANSFIAGLIPPPDVNAAALCNGTPALVETQHTVLNSILAILTFSIYTPMTIEITC
jgi:hypothetical protein